jgi:nucleoside-diphosphate-sugar epimerase
LSLLVIGGCGFVMSNLVLRWLEGDPNARSIVFDRSAPDDALRDFLGPVLPRVEFVVGDLLDRDALKSLFRTRPIDCVVHGGSVTPHAHRLPDGTMHYPEIESPSRIVEVNVLGSVTVLECVRRHGAIRRLLLVSSGSVYSEDPGPEANRATPEDSECAPRSLYGISKLSTEMIARRYAQLFALPITIVRPSTVYGPMDRVSQTRAFRSAPCVIAHAALEGQTVCVNSLESAFDCVLASDVADAMGALLRARDLRHAVYNISFGQLVSVGEMIKAASELAPSLRHEIVSRDKADIERDPSQKGGYWGPYNCSRLCREIDWRPTPMREGMHQYIRWLNRRDDAAREHVPPPGTLDGAGRNQSLGTKGRP